MHIKFNRSIVVYSRSSQFNARTKHYLVNISPIYFFKGPMVCCLRDRWRDISQREDFFFWYLLPRARGLPTLASPWKLVRDTSARLRVPRSTAILCTLCKTDRVVLITWSSSGYTPVQPECPGAPSSFCLLIKMWQLTKVHRVTRNEPKIHVVCYITFSLSNLTIILQFPWFDTWSKDRIFCMRS